MLASGFEQLLDVTVDEDDGEIFVTDYDVGVYRVSVDGTQAKLIIEDVRARGACFAKTSTATIWSFMDPLHHLVKLQARGTY